MSQKINMDRGVSKKIVGIIVACALAAGLLIGGLGVLIYKEISGGSDAGTSSKQAEKDAEKADQLADGEIFDFEEAGYIELGTYKGLKADVQPELEDIYSGMITKAEELELEGDDVVADGDIVNIDFTGKLNGKELEDASAEDAYVWIGKGEYIDDFEKGIVGIQTGKKKTVDCTFPSDYDDEELAGKTVQFTIKVLGRFGNEAAEKASDGKYKTVEEYYKYEQATQLEENRSSKGELVWDELREGVTVESAPKQMLERAKEDVTKMYTSFAELSGVSVEELLGQFGMDEDGLDELANDTVIDVMVAKTIASKEGITMDDAFYQKALMEVLGTEEDEEVGTLEEMENEYRESIGSRPRDDMLVERVKKFIGENATE